MKIQISNFYNLSIILFILSGCQELTDLNIGEQILLDVIETNETKIESEEIKMGDLEKTSVETKKNVVNEIGIFSNTTHTCVVLVEGMCTNLIHWTGL